MGLEETIREDAKICAESIWWGLHDEGNYDGAGARFFMVEALVLKNYAKNHPTPNLSAGEHFANALRTYDVIATPNLSAGEHFANALRTYDVIASDLKNNCSAVDDYNNLVVHIRETYKALRVNENTASHTASWWYNWVRARVAQANGDWQRFGDLLDAVRRNVVEEHKTRYEFNEVTSRTLANIFVSAGMASHVQKDEAVAKELLVQYYTLLLRNLAAK